MAATGHKTMSVFKKYNTVSREELKALAGVEIGTMDTYMATYPESTIKKGQAIEA
jgi:hypothetical protein